MRMYDYRNGKSKVTVTHKPSSRRLRARFERWLKGRPLPSPKPDGNGRRGELESIADLCLPWYEGWRLYCEARARRAEMGPGRARTPQAAPEGRGICSDTLRGRKMAPVAVVNAGV